MMSLNMLIETPGGFDYTGADCVAWMKEAGFSRRGLNLWSAPTRWWSGSGKPAGLTGPIALGRLTCSPCLPQMAPLVRREDV